FFEYDWLTVVKYDNLKGDALKDLMKPTPVTFSPHGLHVKESWGRLNNMELLKRVIENLQKNWQEDRYKYDEKLPPVDENKIYAAENNLPRVGKLLEFLFHTNNPQGLQELKKIYFEQIIIPVPEPGEDEYLLELNSVSANRVEKRAIFGDPDFIYIGPVKVLTYQEPALQNAVD